MNKNKLFLSIVLVISVLLFVALLFGFFFSDRLTKETVNQETAIQESGVFTGTDFSIGVDNRYLTPRYVKNENQQIKGLLEYYLIEDFDSKNWWENCEDCVSGGPDVMTLSVYNNDGNLNLIDWIQQNSNSYGIYTNYYFKDNVVLKYLDKNEAINYSFEGMGFFDEFFWLNPEKTKIYRLQSFALTEDASIREDVWDVFNSFTFLDN